MDRGLHQTFAKLGVQAEGRKSQSVTAQRAQRSSSRSQHTQPHRSSFQYRPFSTSQALGGVICIATRH